MVQRERERAEPEVLVADHRQPGVAAGEAVGKDELLGQWQALAMQVQGNRISQALRQPGAWMDAAALQKLAAATLAKCDAADGLTQITDSVSGTITRQYDVRFDTLTQDATPLHPNAKGSAPVPTHCPTIETGSTT